MISETMTMTAKEVASPSLFFVLRKPASASLLRRDGDGRSQEIRHDKLWEIASERNAQNTRRFREDDSIPLDEICNLDCQNGGSCEIITMAINHHNVIPKICVCPPGYGGLSCQITTSICISYLNQNRYCRNAAPCVIHGGHNECDCTAAHDISAFGGIECEYPATEYCTDDSSISRSSFCTNGGSCKGYSINSTQP